MQSSVDYVSIALQRFLLFSNAGRAQRWYLVISAYTQGRVGRNAELGHDSGFLKAKRVFFIRQKLIRLSLRNFLYLPKAHTIIALQFSLFAKSSYDYCAVIFFIRQKLIRLSLRNFLYSPKAHTIIAAQFSFNHQ